MNFNICLRNRLIVLLAVFAFVLINFWNSAVAQSTRRSSPASGQKFRLPKANSATETEVRQAYLQSMAAESVKFDDHKTVFNDNGYVWKGEMAKNQVASRSLGRSDRVGKDR